MSYMMKPVGMQWQPSNGRTRLNSSTRVALRVLVGGLVLLAVTDWIGEYTRSQDWIQVSRSIRACILVVFVLFLAKGGPRVRGLGSKLRSFLVGVAVILFFFALLDKQPLGGLYSYSRTLYWILGWLVIMRLAWMGALTREIIVNAGVAVSLIAIVFSVFYMRTPAFETDYNASAYLLLYCIPMILAKVPNRSRMFLLAISVVFIVITVKRGAILALLIGILAYAIVSFGQAKKTARTFKYVLVGLLVVLAAGTTVYYRWDRFTERTSRDQLYDVQTGGSGRYMVWRILFYRWKSARIAPRLTVITMNTVHGLEDSILPVEKCRRGHLVGGFWKSERRSSHWCDRREKGGCPQ